MAHLHLRNFNKNKPTSFFRGHRLKSQNRGANCGVN